MIDSWKKKSSQKTQIDDKNRERDALFPRFFCLPTINPKLQALVDPK